ncbi:MAG: GNAT family N-acetyltransferase [Thermoplasmata archaeon]
MPIEVKDMDESSEYFASTCTHVNESEEIDRIAERRLAWVQKMHDKGLRIKVVYADGEIAGFLNAIPIEYSPMGPLGKDLMVVYCLTVPKKFKGKGAGRALMDSIEEEAKRQGKKGLVTYGYRGDFWFMPASFLEKHGFEEVDSRRVDWVGENEFLEEMVLLWKPFDESAEPPTFPESKYKFQPVPGKVVVDLFWDIFCQTTNTEGERVKDVAEEFGDKVILNEYPAHEPGVFLKYHKQRGIFINGKEIVWGYEAPKEGIREAIRKALEEVAESRGEV